LFFIGLFLHENIIYFFGLNMIFVHVIWARFDLRPCKKKIEKRPCKFFLFEKGPWPHYSAEVAWLGSRGKC